MVSVNSNREGSILEIAEQKQLIEKLVKSNPKFSGNEDLLEDFCGETLQKTYIIFNSDAPIQKIESYLTKVVNTSMSSVLKNFGRLKRTGRLGSRLADDGSTVELKYSFDVKDPGANPEQDVISADLLQSIADALCIIHNSDPSKLYLDLFICRYVKEMKQKETAKELNISQSEVSKRLIALSKLLKDKLET